jgi:hypothetical protein
MFTPPHFERILTFVGVASGRRSAPDPLRKEVAMSRVRSFMMGRVILALLAIVSLLPIAGLGQTRDARRIAGFGSSVAFGTGDENGKEGYTGMLRDMLAAKGWDVLNQSRGGDTTKTLPVNPSYVVIGLSLANEGIFEARTKDEKDAVFQQFADGIKGFVAKARQQHIVPVVTLCYPRAVYTPVEYEYIRRMNILENSWDVPSVNFLGAVDDGHGQWAKGLMYNDKHPNASGHREMFLTFVPTLFDALEHGKPGPARPIGAKGFARISGGMVPLTFTPDSTVHSFAISVMVRTPAEGTIAAVSGSTLAAKTERKKFGASQIVEFDETTLAADRPFTAAIGVQKSTWTYTSAAGTTVASTVGAGAQWHHVVLSHYAARGETLFFIDGKLAGSVAERLEPTRFVIGGPASAQDIRPPAQADYKDVFIFRSALNADEVAALGQGRLLQASLEVYSPLTDAQFPADSTVSNLAQSLAALRVGSGRIVHADDDARPTE